MRRSDRPGLRACAALLACSSAWAALTSTAPATAAPDRALPAVCDTSAADPDVWTWVHDTGTTVSWQDPTSWRHTVAGVAVPGVPPGDGTAILCLRTHDTVVATGIGPAYLVNQLHVDAPTSLVLPSGTGLYAGGSADSELAPGTVVVVDGGSIGGHGAFRAQGTLRFTAASGTTPTLSTVPNGNGQTPPAGTGHLVVEGQVEVAAGALALVSGYRIMIANGGTLTLADGAWLVGDAGTSVTVQPGGTLVFNGDGGHYRGAAVAGQPPTLLRNDGTMRKAAGGTTVVDAAFDKGIGQLQVRSGTLALPDDRKVTASVSERATVMTGTCGTTPSAPCGPSEDPAVDPAGVSLTVPAGNGGPASVKLQELSSAATSDPKGIGVEVLAHADGLVADASHPATVVLRMSQPEVMATPLDQVQVVHTLDGGQQVLLPDCKADGTLPGGQAACVVRPVVRHSQATVVTVHTTETSRWHLRRDTPVETTGIPGPPRKVVAARGASGRPLTVVVSWRPPSSSAATPVKRYQVVAYRTDGSTAAIVKVRGDKRVARLTLPAGAYRCAVRARTANGPGPWSPRTSRVRPR